MYAYLLCWSRSHLVYVSAAESNTEIEEAECVGRACLSPTRYVPRGGTSSAIQGRRVERCNRRGASVRSKMPKELRNGLRKGVC